MTTKRRYGPKRAQCVVPGCETGQHGRGLCNKHRSGIERRREIQRSRTLSGLPPICPACKARGAWDDLDKRMGFHCVLCGGHGHNMRSCERNPEAACNQEAA